MLSGSFTTVTPFNEKVDVFKDIDIRWKKKDDTIGTFSGIDWCREIALGRTRSMCKDLKLTTTGLDIPEYTWIGTTAKVERAGMCIPKTTKEYDLSSIFKIAEDIMNTIIEKHRPAFKNDYHFYYYANDLVVSIIYGPFDTKEILPEYILLTNIAQLFTKSIIEAIMGILNCEFDLEYYKKQVKISSVESFKKSAERSCKLYTELADGKRRYLNSALSATNKEQLIASLATVYNEVNVLYNMLNNLPVIRTPDYTRAVSGVRTFYGYSIPDDYNYDDYDYSDDDEW